MAYATGAELVVRYDARRIAQLVADDGQQVASGSVAAHAVVEALLEDATAAINSAVYVGKRYVAADLSSGLTASGGYLLKRLCCDLAFGYLVARRGLAADEVGKLAPRYAEALQYLDLLRQGERIFDTADGSHAEAGLMDHKPVGALDPNNVNSIVFNMAPFFGMLPSNYTGGL